MVIFWELFVELVIFWDLFVQLVIFWELFVELVIFWELFVELVTKGKCLKSLPIRHCLHPRISFRGRHIPWEACHGEPPGRVGIGRKRRAKKPHSGHPGKGEPHKTHIF